MLEIKLNTNSLPLHEYSDRPTVKAVIVNKDGGILVFNSNLVGGGVEDGETNEEALHRETLEETGTTIEIVRPLGQIIAYRYATKQRYVMYGYLCKYIETKTQPVDETANPAFWENPNDSIARLQRDIDELKNQKIEELDRDTYEALLYNREMSVAFIKEAFS